MLRLGILSNEFGKNFGAKTREEIKYIYSELGTNILRHAGQGEIEFRFTPDGLEIISRNPGTLELKAFLDGYSTAKSLGLGIGVVGRFSDDFSYSSENNQVTIKVLKTFHPPETKADIACFSEGFSSETNGDAFVKVSKSSYFLLGVADVLGHGSEAHEIALKIRKFLQAYHFLSLQDILSLLDMELRGKRGAAVSLLKIDFLRDKIFYCGVGNIECRIYPPQPEAFISFPGVVGGRIDRLKLSEIKKPTDSVFILYTDGVSNPVVTSRQLRNSATEIASNLIKNFGKPNDDRTVLVAKL
jgi:anti-sigma regulatory factor (Ser/Thr protein kinase)